MASAGITFIAALIVDVLNILEWRKLHAGLSLRGQIYAFCVTSNRSDRRPVPDPSLPKSKRQIWKGALLQLILGLSDQQLVTGMAVLISGYARHCDINVYHFEMVGDLAFLSSLTHLVTIHTLREYFMEQHSVRN